MTRAELNERKAKNPHLFLDKKKQSVYLVKEVRESRIAANAEKLITAR